MKTLFTKQQLIELFKDSEHGFLLESIGNCIAGAFRFEKEFEVWVNKFYDFIGGGIWRAK